jgi:Flp pilus assembly pilin Flp
MLLSTYNYALWSYRHLVGTVRRHLREDRGAALVEYALLMTLIVMACLAAVTVLGSRTSASTTDSANSIMAAN